MTATTAARGFAPIALDELNATAALMRRVDRKYLLRSSEATAVLDAFPEGMRALTIENQQEFEYMSTYFDTHSWDSYLMAARGRPHRFKVRIRHYQGSDQAFLEVKTREGGQTVKRRIPHDTRSLMAVHPHQHMFVEESLTSGRIHGIRPAWLIPALQTSYRRSTLLAPDASTRITIDRQLHWYAMGAGATDTAGLVVLETKSPGAAGDIDRLLWSMGHRPARISKYATGLAALRPELPSNKWHRTLLTQFH
ncbi:MAG: polyphosphate polymerase domain-containing protein [Arachnia sp.]